MAWKNVLRLKIAFFLCSVCSCNGVFYQPLREIVYQPSDLKLDYQEEIIETEDQQTLHAWRLPAKGQSKGIAVLQFHGNAENRSTHFMSVAWLVMHGVDVVTFDYRGYDGSSGDPSRRGLVLDGKAAIQWFKKAYPHHKRYVVGQSLGGAVAVAALAEPGVQDQLSGLVLESTFHSYRGIARMKFASSWLLWLFQWMPYVLLSGDENPVDLAPRIHLPVIAFHDKDDPVVPLESGKILYDELAKQAAVRFFPLDGRRHVAAFADPKGMGREKLFEFFGVKE